MKISFYWEQNWPRKYLQTTYVQFSLLLLRIMDEIKPNCSIFSTLKKTRATYTVDSSGEKDFKKFQTEHKLPNVESISNFNLKRRIQFSETKLSLFPGEQKDIREVKRQSTNPQRKQNEIEIKQKQVSVDDILSKSLKLAKSCYDRQSDFAQFKLTANNKNKIDEFNKNFKERIVQIIKEIKYKQKQLACHLNTVFFCRQNVRLLPLMLIEKEIFKQWRQNILLSSIKSEWMVCLQKYLPEFDTQGYVIFSEIIYEDFCIFMSHLTFLVFEAYYQHKIQIEGVEKQYLIERLNKRTMRYVVTQSSQWQNIICLHIEEILKPKAKYEKISAPVRKKLISQFISEMKIKPIHDLLSELQSENEKLFPCTQQSIPRLLKQHYIPAKVKCILNVRVALQQDIIQYQKILIERQKLHNIEMLEKDPMLTCLILAVLSSEIDLEAIDLALRQIKLMLGPDYHEILNAQKCPSYYVDLTSVIEQLIIEVRMVTKQLSKISS